MISPGILTDLADKVLELRRVRPHFTLVEIVHTVNRLYPHIAAQTITDAISFLRRLGAFEDWPQP